MKTGRIRLIISAIFLKILLNFPGTGRLQKIKSITAGLGKINGATVAVIGHNKGKDIKERVEFNFG